MQYHKEKPGNCRSNKIPQTLTRQQTEFLNGLMLGDGSIVWPRKMRSLYPRLCAMRQLKDKDYLFWQYEVFKDFYGTEPKYFKTFDSRTDKYYDGYASRTRTGQILKDCYEKWYPNGKKIVPRDLELTPLTLLIWFLDDGCVVKNAKHAMNIKLSTDGFTEEDTIFLSKLLGTFIGEEIKVYKNGSGFILRGYTLAAAKIIKIIEPIFPEFMERKRTWRDFDWEYLENNKSQFGDGVGKTFGNIKLNMDIARQIRKLRIEENISTKDLAIRFGVSKATINLVIANKEWKEGSRK